MDFGWVPESIRELRFLLDDIYSKSPTLWYMLVLSIPSLFGYAIYSFKPRQKEKSLDKRAKKSSRRRR